MWWCHPVVKFDSPFNKLHLKDSNKENIWNNSTKTFETLKNIWRVSLVKNGEEVVSVGGAVDPRCFKDDRSSSHMIKHYDFGMITIIVLVISVIISVFSHKNSGNSASSSIVLQLVKVASSSLPSSASSSSSQSWVHMIISMIKLITGGPCLVAAGSRKLGWDQKCSNWLHCLLRI